MSTIAFFNRSISLTLGDIRGRRMAELGDQKIWAMVALKQDGSRMWAKDWFELRGCHHYSIDIHGNNGAHPLDLSKPIMDPFWQNNFDIVTNFGTSEHVENQFECWRNIHNLGRLGCVYIHVLPGPKRRSFGDCEIYYTREFFSNLCLVNNYTLILHQSIPLLGHLAICYIKIEKGQFASNKEKFLTEIIEK